MSTKIFYHQYDNNGAKRNCPDGIAAAWVVFTHLQTPVVEVIGVDYQSPAPQVSPGDEVYIVDFSFPAPVLEEMHRVADSVLLLDHHATALKMVESLSDAIRRRTVFDMNESGATLAFKHFFPDTPLPLWLQYVRDRDIWTKKLPHTDEVYSAMSHLRHQCQGIGDIFALFDKWQRMPESEWLSQMVEIGTPIRQEYLARCRELASTAKIETFRFPQSGAFQVPVIDLDEKTQSLVSDTGSLLYTSQDVPFVLFRRHLPECIKYEMRGKGVPHCGELAREYGGGGHPGASGFRIETVV